MKAKVKQDKKRLYVELYLKKLLKRVKNRGEEVLFVQVDKEPINFLVTKVSEDNYVVSYEEKGILTREIPKNKVVTSIKRIVKMIAKDQELTTSFI